MRDGQPIIGEESQLFYGAAENQCVRTIDRKGLPLTSRPDREIILQTIRDQGSAVHTRFKVPARLGIAFALLTDAIDVRIDSKTPMMNSGIPGDIVGELKTRGLEQSGSRSITPQLAEVRDGDLRRSRIRRLEPIVRCRLEPCFVNPAKSRLTDCDHPLNRACCANPNIFGNLDHILVLL